MGWGLPLEWHCALVVLSKLGQPSQRKSGLSLAGSVLGLPVNWASLLLLLLDLGCIGWLPEQPCPGWGGGQDMHDNAGFNCLGPWSMQIEGLQ